MENHRDHTPPDPFPEEPAPEVLSAAADRTVDFVSLKALAHPLRIRLLEVLSSYGAQTASSIAQRLGESSGATSYHLRQLAKHGFVREVAGKGTARERWWERPPGSLTVTTPELAADPASRDAARLVNTQLGLERARLLADFVDNAFDVLPSEWSEASMIATLHTHLTADQLAEITRDTEAFLRSKLAQYRGQQGAPGTRPVQIHFNAFPIIDAP
jgi:DNA-binding transcriptional ArsR family regulator